MYYKYNKNEPFCARTQCKKIYSYLWGGTNHLVFLGGRIFMSVLVIFMMAKNSGMTILSYRSTFFNPDFRAVF